MTSLQCAISILDALVPTKQTTELERSEEDIPDAIVDLFEADILANTLTWRLETHEDNRR